MIATLTKVLRRVFSPEPEVPETPMKRMGYQAFEDNRPRRAPAVAFPQERLEWLAGWDEAEWLRRQW